MNGTVFLLGLSIGLATYGQGAPSAHPGAGRPAGHARGGASMPHAGSIAGASRNVNRMPADMTGKTSPQAQSSFSRSYVASAPYLNPTPIEAFPGAGFLPGAVPPRATGNPPKWITHGFNWMPWQGKFAGHSMWGPFGNGYLFPGQGYRAGGYYSSGGYGYYPYGWGGDGTFLIVGDSALRAWAGEPVDGYPPEIYGGPMPWAGMPMFFPNQPPQPSLPEGMAFAQFTGVPETIVLDFPPGSRVRP